MIPSIVMSTTNTMRIIIPISIMDTEAMGKMSHLLETKSRVVAEMKLIESVLMLEMVVNHMIMRRIGSQSVRIRDFAPYIPKV